MAGRIRDDDIEAVKARTDMVALAAQYLTMKKAGADRFVGLCPFHQEKTPSFGISPSKQLYYCHGCGAGGDSIRFIRELEHLSYVEAVERLAQQAGVQLRYEGDSPEARRNAARKHALYRANEQAAELFASMLADGKEAADARTYVAERGISAESLQTFGVGFAPSYRDFLLRRLSQSRDLSPEILLEAGLATRGDDGQVRDRFRARVTFPIHDLQGRGIGFGARILPTDQRASEQAKYLNTAETPIYKKHEVLYNLHRARQAVAREGEVFVVEGYTDVIGLVQAGIENAVATCGTALGEGHFRQLSRFAQRAILAFDSDEAGARAAERAFAFQEQFPSVQAMVMIIPQGLDPADFVAKHGADAVKEAAKTARPLIEYMLRRMIGRVDLSSVEGQSQAVADAMPILSKLTDPVRRSEYAHLVADLAGVTESSVRQSLDATAKGRPTAVVVESPKRMSARDKLEREMLKLLVRDREVYDTYGPRLTDEHFRSASARRAVAALQDAGGEVAVVAGGDDEKLAALVSSLAVEPLDSEGEPGYAASVWARLQEFVLKAKSDAMRMQLQKLNPTTDPAYDELFGELVQVDGELRRLRQSTRSAV
ncbi:MAG TPA: DNA primase [Actinomycetota bacterium]|nr:DNA primase [Actinomycetota bacterium]